MSSSDSNNAVQQMDWNETAMAFIVYSLVTLMTILIIGFIVTGLTRECEPFESDQKTGDRIISISLSKNNGNMIDVTLKKDRVPIDYWIFEQIVKARKDVSEDDKTRYPRPPTQIYMTDMADDTFSNQNLRALVNHIMETYDLSKTRVLINWIFNHSRFTSSLTKRYRMYNLHKKYYPLPLDANDYDTPLLDSARPVDVSKDPTTDIVSHNYLDVPMTSKVMCSDQLFVEQDREFSLYCNGDYLQYSDRPDNYMPIIARYYMIVSTDPKPMFSFTSDGLVAITSNALDNEDPDDDQYVYKNGETTNSKIESDSELSYQSLSSLIRPDPAISWYRVKNRIDQKLSKLGELIVLEHRQESTVDGIEKLLRRTNVDLYQIFAIDIVIRGGEPYVYKIEASPTFREYGHEIAHDMLQSLIERTVVMLEL